MEDQQNGYIYETASPAELGAAGYRGRALLSGAVRRRGDGPSGACSSRGNPEPGPEARRTAAAAD